MKLDGLIQRVQSAYSHGVQSDESRLRPQHIYHKLCTVRAKLLEQKAKKKQAMSQWNQQTIPCVELIKAPLHECPCLPPTGCQILRSKYPIPKPLIDLNQELIKSVTSIDSAEGLIGITVYDPISWEDKKYKAGNKYTANSPDYFIRNNYLYITWSSGPKIITITGLFEDPLEVENFKTYCDDLSGETDCEDCDKCLAEWEKDFPIDKSMVDTLIELAANELIGLFTQMHEDITNNTRDTDLTKTKQ